MMQNVRVIKPAVVERDEIGQWVHPDLPDLDDDVQAYRRWAYEEQRLDITQSLMPDSQGEKAEQGCVGWNPLPPAGPGWFMLAIADTCDGPCVTWARPQRRKGIPLLERKAPEQTRELCLELLRDVIKGPDITFTNRNILCIRAFLTPDKLYVIRGSFEAMLKRLYAHRYKIDEGTPTVEQFINHGLIAPRQLFGLNTDGSRQHSFAVIEIEPGIIWGAGEARPVYWSQHPVGEAATASEESRSSDPARHQVDWDTDLAFLLCTKPQEALRESSDLSEQHVWLSTCAQPGGIADAAE